MSGTNNLSPKNWVIISGLGFVVSFALFISLFFLPGFKQVFIRLQGLVFYIMLIPFALICAGFLFGALKSYAKASGKNIHGTLKLGGPVVVFVIVMWGGLEYQRNIAPNEYFTCTIQFYTDDESRQLIEKGVVRLKADGILPVPMTFDNGFLNVSMLNSARGKKLEIIPEVAGYASREIYAEIPDDNQVKVFIEPLKYLSKISGYVFDGASTLVKGPYVIEWGGVRDTLETGHYQLDIPYEAGSSQNLKIFKEGKLLYSVFQAIPEKTHDIKLE